MGVLVDRTPSERSDLGHVPRVVARGLLDQVNAAWIGAHPGFADLIHDDGVGDQTVYLAAAGAATMLGRATVATTPDIAHAVALAGATLQDLQVIGLSHAGAPADVVCFIEVLQPAV